MKKRAMYVKPKTEVLLLYKEDVVTGSLDNNGAISGDPGSEGKTDISGGGESDDW